MIRVTEAEHLSAIPEQHRGQVTRHFNLISEQFDHTYKFKDSCEILFIQPEDDIEDLPYLNKEDKGLLCDSGLDGWPAGWSWEDWDETDGVLNIAILCNNEFGILVFCPREHADPRLIEVFDRKMKDK